MRQKTKLIAKLSGALILSASLASCGLLKKKDESSDTSASPEDLVGSGDVQMTGSLSLIGSSASGASLRLSTYDLYCVTFMEEPTACKVEVDSSSGAFDQSCEKFAGTSFGCFVRQDGKTLATVEFDYDASSDSSLIAGAGQLKMDIVFDAATGSAIAKIDPSSSALSEEALAGIKNLLEQGKTELPNLTGTWDLEFDCSEGESTDGPCSDKAHLTQDEEAMSIYINHTTVGERNVAAIWESEDAKNRCIGDAGEGKPSFRMGDTPFDFSSKEAYEKSVAAVYSALPSNLRAVIKDEVLKRESTMWGWCNEGAGDPYQALFTAENCKFIEAKLEQHTVFEDGQEKTIYMPKWYSPEDFDTVTEYTGTVNTETVACSSEFQEGVPTCPPELGPDATSFTNYISANKNPIMLLCKDNVSGFFEQMPARGKTEAEAISAVTSGAAGAKDDSCEKITSGPYSGLIKASAREVGRTVTELLSRAGNRDEEDHMCGSQLPSNFNFNMCETMSDNERPSICWDKDWIMNDMALKLDGSGKMIADTSRTPQFFNHQFAELACPTALDSLQNSNQYDEQAAAIECRNEFAAKTIAQQVQKISDQSAQWRPLAEKILCDSTQYEEAISTVKSLAQNSCMPEIFNDEICDERGCVRTLRCPGSSEGGKCFDEAGNFAGRISGRMALMNVKPRIAGSFEMSEQNVDRWQGWDAENNKQVECKHIHRTIINARLESETSWKGMFNSASKEECGDNAEDGAGFMESFQMKATKQ
ncbi:MAG: hypothetical protein R3B45_09185 [Bdellovibrionota bacterium]